MTVAMPKAKERELIRLAQGGDAEALDALLHQYRNYVWEIAIKVFNKHRAKAASTGLELEDLVQIGMAKLVESVHKYDFSYDAKLASFATLGLWSVMQRSFSKRRLDAIPSNSLDAPIAGTNVKNRDPESCDSTLDEVIRREEIERVVLTLNRLPLRTRTILIGRINGRTLEDIGSEIGLTRERVRQLEEPSIKRFKAMWDFYFEGFDHVCN